MSYARRRWAAREILPGHRPARPLLLAALAFLLLFAVEALAQAAAPHAPVLATWQTQVLSFTYQDSQTSYSCESLGEKVWRTLLFLGARPDMRIRIRECGTVDPLRNASAFGIGTPAPITMRIEIATPYEIEPVDRDGVTGELGRRDLLRKTSGRKSENLDLAEQFPAFWERIRVSGLQHLQPGDCAMLLQMQQQLFGKLNIRVVEDRMSCLPGRQFRGEGVFEVEALVQAQLRATPAGSAPPQ